MKVLIRDHMAGVLFGTLETFDLGAGTWTLADARKIHFWRRAGAIEGVAVRGIDACESRVTARTGRQMGRNLVQLVELTDAQFEALDATPEWKP